MCAARPDLMEGFKRNYDEVPTVSGLASNGAVLEIIASPSGTWTLIAVAPNGTACLIVSGTAWKIADTKPGGI